MTFFGNRFQNVGAATAKERSRAIFSQVLWMFNTISYNLIQNCHGQISSSQMLIDGRTDGQTDGRTEWGIAIALSQIGWLGAKDSFYVE